MEGARQIDSVLNSRGVSVEVATLDAPNSGEFLYDYPAPVHALGPSRGGYRYNSKLVPWLKKNHSRFNAVIVDGLWQYHSFAVWRVLADSRTPYFVYSHGMLDPWFKHAYPFKHIKKWLYWPWAEYRVLRDAMAVLFTCEEERQLARRSFWLYQCNEAVTSFGTSFPPNDISAQKEAFLSKHPQLRNKRIFLFLSRIHEKKGCDLLIDSFAKVCHNSPDLHLVMAGPDQTGWKANLTQQAERLGISDRITWPGMLQGAEKWGAFYAAEVFCLPSHQENFGIVVAEALGCGKPVLISDKVNIWREIEADGAGIVRPDTVEGTIDSLRTWLALSSEAQNRMCEAGRHCFENRYSIERVATNLIDIISRHLDAGASKRGTSEAA